MGFSGGGCNRHSAQPLGPAFSSDDCKNGGSDRLVDAVVAWGDLETIRNRIRAHQSAGADHVCIQALTANSNSLPLQEWRELASALIERA